MIPSATRDRGQIMALFAFSIVGIVALIALIVDGGFLYVQRRTAQASADAGALAGTRALREASSVAAIYNTAVNTAHANAFGITPTVSCVSLVDKNGASLGTIGGSGSNCSGPTAVSIANASGVHVDVQITYPTILAGMLRVASLSAAGGATAQLGVPSGVWTNDAPLIVCGGGSQGVAGMVSTGPVVTVTTGGEVTHIPSPLLPTYNVGPNTGYTLEQFLTTDASGKVIVDPAKDGHVYYLKGQYIGHWATSNAVQDNGCGAASNKFDGGAVGNQQVIIPGQMYGTNGNSVSVIGAQVEAPGGCAGGTDFVNNWSAGQPGCIMLLPVANGATQVQSNTPLFNIPVEAAFYVWCNKSSNSVCQEWVGQLIAREDVTGNLLQNIALNGTNAPSGPVAVHITA
jgi:putative Flp pilus-assembly TadE/G-like protein